MGFFLQVSGSLELAGAKTARDFRNLQKAIGVEPRSSAVTWTVVVREAKGWGGGQAGWRQPTL